MCTCVSLASLGLCSKKKSHSIEWIFILRADVGIRPYEIVTESHLDSLKAYVITRSVYVTALRMVSPQVVLINAPQESYKPQNAVILNVCEGSFHKFQERFFVCDSE